MQIKMRKMEKKLKSIFPKWRESSLCIGVLLANWQANKLKLVLSANLINLRIHLKLNNAQREPEMLPNQMEFWFLFLVLFFLFVFFVIIFCQLTANILHKRNRNCSAANGAQIII